VRSSKIILYYTESFKFINDVKIKLQIYIAHNIINCTYYNLDLLQKSKQKDESIRQVDRQMVCQKVEF